MPQIEGHGLRPRVVRRGTARPRAFDGSEGQGFVFPSGPAEIVALGQFIESRERWRGSTELSQRQKELRVAILRASGRSCLLDRLGLVMAMTGMLFDFRAAVVVLRNLIDHLTTAGPDGQSIETMTIQNTTLRGGSDRHHQGEEESRCQLCKDGLHCP